MKQCNRERSPDLDRFSPQDEERFRPLRQKARKLVNQDVFNLVCLLDLDRHPDAIHAGLHQDPLILVPRYCQGIQEQLWRRSGLDLRDVVSFGRLRGKV